MNLNYLLFVLGAILVIYSNVGKETNEYVSILGIAILMIGIYRVSRNIPSKSDQETSMDESEND